ncbi:MAG: helix-turn-helix transcriptional regulator [Lachnospiraceae bacterium]|nr:helix-turn-helix transcriptional regulator [Lachnospiraceae bacterium]
MGQTPKDYCSHMRLMQAKYLMRTTNLPVSVIAQEVGIESETYFYRFFRKMEGITPQEYRQNYLVIVYGNDQNADESEKE